LSLQADRSIVPGETKPGRGAAVSEYTSVKGEEPPDHTHPTEDEVFYVLSGEVTFRCAGKEFDLLPLFHEFGIINLSIAFWFSNHLPLAIVFD
jgi:quercetin dioxygenase-like cupin family protein